MGTKGGKRASPLTPPCPGCPAIAAFIYDGIKLFIK